VLCKNGQGQGGVGGNDGQLPKSREGDTERAWPQRLAGKDGHKRQVGKPKSVVLCRILKLAINEHVHFLIQPRGSVRPPSVSAPSRRWRVSHGADSKPDAIRVLKQVRKGERSNRIDPGGPPS